MPDVVNGLKTGCPLYPTKPENVPKNLMGAISAAETLRTYKTLGVLPPLSELSAWEFTCLTTAEAASSTIEAEALQNATGNQGPAINKSSPMGEVGLVEEGGAFSGW